ncbi:MAG: hypothetical protein CVV52_05150 [Spirochaetae bacterium HGW-Spirochaetae-8]|nr:MAG: hypothetical protein CVV52_05150 [Spirochaetae bacterium HGW-Spirochaetae-8]
MAEAYIQPNILKWARGRLSYTESFVATKFKMDVVEYKKWETGISRPSFSQAKKLADLFYVPFGYLYLQNPPERFDRIPDLRTMASRGVKEPSPNLQAVINDVISQQKWYKSYLLENGSKPLGFIGGFSAETPIDVITASIRKELGIPDRWHSYVRNTSDYILRWIAHAETKRISILRSGIVGNSTSRDLDPREFRGFAICDEVAPYIFINSKDSDTAKVFTLVHELVHLWIGASGISSIDEPTATHDDGVLQIERYCNRVAADLLIPAEGVSHSSVDVSLILKDSHVYHVSPFVVLYRYHDLGMVSSHDFHQLYDVIEDISSEKLPNEKKDTESGGSFYNNLFAKSGKPFIDALVGSVLEGRTLYRDAAQLLNVKTSVIDRIAERRGLL